MRVLSALRLTFVVFALLPAASASAVPALTLPPATGLAEPAGLARTPDGALWVSDAASGVCRATIASPGLVQDGTWCSDAASAIRAPGQMAFDVQSSNFYVADGKPAGGGIWRLHWNAATGTIDSGARLINTPNDRVLGLALSPSGDIDFSTKHANVIRRVVDPAGTAPTVETVGSALHAGPASLAHLGEALYIAEPNGVTVIDAPGPSRPQARVVPGFPGGVPAAVAADVAGGRVYAGTGNGNSQDQVDVLSVSTGAVETYQEGFAGVTALADDGNALLVADDPAAAAGGVGVDGGRVWSLPTAVLGPPAAIVDLAPPTVTAASVATFAYSAPSAARFECRFDSPTWTPCGGPGAGSRSYAGLAEGIHVFEVRAIDVDPDIGTGDPTRRTFVVDRTPPSVTIDVAQPTITAGSAIEFGFSSNEENVAYSCSLDGAPPEPCQPPRTLTGLAVGTHRLAVTAVDLAGNTSDPPATAVFSVVEPPPPPVAVELPAPEPAPTQLVRQLRAQLCTGLPSATTVFQIPATRVSRKRLRFAGWAVETPCAGAVRVAIARVRKGVPPAQACRFLTPDGLFGRPRSCGAPVYIPARGRASWSVTVRSACCSGFPTGTYVAAVALTPLAGGPRVTPALLGFRVR
jgi:hypothetical protein